MRGAIVTFLFVPLVFAAAFADTPEPPLAPVLPGVPAPTIHFPDLPHPDVPVPVPPSPTTIQPLYRGQWYIVDFADPLVVDQFGLDGAEVTISHRKGPLPVPADIAVGRKPDKDDPEICTIAGPHVYVIKAKTNGRVILDVLPALNRLDSDKKAIAFTARDITRRLLDVGGVVPPPPPPPPPPNPTTPSPFPQAGLRALLMYEKDDLGTTKMPFNLTDPAFEGIFASCVDDTGKRPDGSTLKAYRVLDKDTDVSKAAPWVRDGVTAFKTSGKPVPSIVVGNGKAGEITPISGMTIPAVKALVEKYK